MTLQKLLDKNKCTEEERKACANYLLSLRIIERLPDLRLLFINLKNIFKP